MLDVLSKTDFIRDVLQMPQINTLSTPCPLHMQPKNDAETRPSGPGKEPAAKLRTYL